jgi:hypothetical protein
MTHCLPGQPRPNEDVVREYADAKHQLLRANPHKAVVVDLLYPDPEAVYRWRVTFDCGCIDERLTGSDDPDSLAKSSAHDPVSQRRLPPGHHLCGLQHDLRARPVRDIVDWGERRVVGLPADPIESDEIDPLVWAKIRRPKPHEAAFWKTRLSCGHFEDVVTEMDWKPDDGPSYPSAERLKEMRAEWPDEDDDSYYVQLLRAGWPRPAPFRECRVCPRVRSVVAHEPVGWLAKRKPVRAKSQTRPSRATLESQLRAAEAKTARLRNELKYLPADDGQARNASHDQD